MNCVVRYKYIHKTTITHAERNSVQHTENTCLLDKYFGFNTWYNEQNTQ